MWFDSLIRDQHKIEEIPIFESIFDGYDGIDGVTYNQIIGLSNAIRFFILYTEHLIS